MPGVFGRVSGRGRRTSCSPGHTIKTARTAPAAIAVPEEPTLAPVRMDRSLRAFQVEIDGIRAAIRFPFVDHAHHLVAIEEDRCAGGPRAQIDSCELLDQGRELECCRECRACG